MACGFDDSSEDVDGALDARSGSSSPVSSSSPEGGDVGAESETAPRAIDGSAASHPTDSAPDARRASFSWERKELGEMPAEWSNRDGAQLVQLGTGRILMIGGWNPEDLWGPLGGLGSGNGGDRTTNEVWASDDLGVTWQLLLPHESVPPTSGPNARFLPGHTVGLTTFDGHAVLIGSDPNNAQEDYLGDVWQESENGTRWTRVSTSAPTLGRALFMCGTYKNAIYIMGGQGSLFDPSTALNDVWRSTDGGVSWTRLPDAPWSPRGIVYRPVEHAGKLYIIGGGRYASDPYVPTAFNGVYAFDGTNWETILPDGHSQFEASFYDAMTSASGRLWLFNGYDSDRDVELSRAMFSDDDGAHWTPFADGSGGAESHADAVLVTQDRILRISGRLAERAIHAFIWR